MSNDVPPNPGPDHPTYTPIKICQANVRSVVAELDSNYKALNERPPKIIELDAFCTENDVNIMGISESWCNEDHSEKLTKVTTPPPLSMVTFLNYLRIWSYFCKVLGCKLTYFEHCR